VWDYETGECERTLRGHTNAVQDIAFDQTGNILASCSADLTIKLWDFGTTYDNIKTLRGHDHNVSTIAFMPSGDTLVSGSRDMTIKLWEVASGFCIKTFNGHSEWVRSVVVSPDGTLIASGSTDHTIRIWVVASGECKHILKGHDHVVDCLAFSPASVHNYLTSSLSTEVDDEAAPKEEDKSVAGKYLVSGSRDKTIKLWDVSTGQCLKTFADHDNWVRGVLFHPLGKYIISCSEDRSIRIFDLKEGRNVKTIQDAHPHFVTTIAFNYRRPVVCTGSVDQTIKIWECR